jgi:hypothetical protein
MAHDYALDKAKRRVERVAKTEASVVRAEL